MGDGAAGTAALPGNCSRLEARPHLRREFMVVDGLFFTSQRNPYKPHFFLVPIN